MPNAKTVDARGLPCPRPVIETKKALGEIEKGSITVIVDRPEARDNVQRFAKSQGCKVKVSQKEGIFRIAISKTKTTQVEAKRNDIVILITGDQFGTGDEIPCKKLMKSFLETLCDSEAKPAKIILMNSAVKLAAEGSDVLEALLSLEENGVEISSCGTCVDYYQLGNVLRAGKMSNMYDAIQSLMSAEKVIKI
ncbi:MAG: sulfurtransferase-like selenium metabolism protein YedF [Dehalococcoidia bacterium]|jgi:TusA-related sulfurtransferase